MKQFILFSLLIVGIANVSYTQYGFKNLEDNKRSDTVDVLDYKMILDFTAMGSQILSGQCRVKFQSKMNNIDGISLDLLQFFVDSVKQGNSLITYSYNDTLLRAHLNTTLLQNDIDSVTVYYTGTPQTDPSGFGGFYFQGDYAYNLGVGFQADPHNYGRTWHPCFDNFVERATYDIILITPQGKTGYSNGYIADESVGANNENIRRWVLEETIPTYLACVGVAPYTHVAQQYVSSLTNAQIPVMLIAEPQDTTNFKNSFVNLFGAMEIFESNYGPYVWNKIAFALVPFNGGAMEHATCIMYPKITANGTLQYETLMAHELSHHWWGNLVTCRTAGDMWINEGIASYSESLFLEHTYSYQDYINELKGVHRDVIQTAHFDDGDFYALSGVPHSATYGVHSYQKGATMMHNLRTHMGDTDFFAGLNAIQTNYAFQDIDAAEFRDELENATGQNLTSFFDNYVFNPGFNGFEIDSFKVQPSGNQFNVDLYVEQKLFEAPAFFESVPMQVTFVDSDKNTFSTNVLLNGQYSFVSVQVPFEPLMVYLNGDYGLLNAVTGEDLWITQPGVNVMNYSYFYVNTESASDSNLLRVEHYRVSPDPIQSPFIAHQFVISTDRYWKVDGIWSADFENSARFTFDARNISSGNLDNQLMDDHNGVTFHEDSIVLLWRPDQKTRWEEYPFYAINTAGSSTNGFCRADVSLLSKGEYTFGFRKNVANIIETGIKDNRVDVFPNPTREEVTLKFYELPGEKKIYVRNMQGEIVRETTSGSDKITLDIRALSTGAYQFAIHLEGKLLDVRTVIKN
ncbi:MAG: M1 family aminopeptidase [Brumimicrobium sp.]|nr:M1 family aminopeptidase [Brumimicrobium sp.]